MVDIGEKMSAAVDMDSLIFDERGDVFDSRENFLLHRPLDIGRLAYAKLRQRLQPEVGVEIWWDHFHDSIKTEVSRDGFSHRLSFHSTHFRGPRLQTLQVVDNIVEQIESEVNKWQ